MKNLLKRSHENTPLLMEFSWVIFLFRFNCLVYSGSRMIAGGWYHHNIETDVDGKHPFCPRTF